MARTIRLLIAYDGGGFHGWQRQHNGPTIQGEIERGLTTICGRPVTLHGAGRTDAGVHALGMVAHFHTPTTIPLAAFTRGLNSLLSKDIRILHAEEAEPGFHSRFSALGKAYCYHFFTGEVQLPCSRRHIAHQPGRFEADRLREPLAALIGTHDFASFEHSGSRDKEAEGGRGAVRTIFSANCLARPEPDCWSIRLIGDGFLRQMVRIIAGTLIEIGQGKRPPDAMPAILAARDRTKAGLTAPACGLVLETIFYTPMPDWSTPPI